MIPHFTSRSDLPMPPPRPSRIVGKPMMVMLAEALRQMRPGIDCISLTMSQAQSARLIAAGMGYAVVTDAWRNETMGEHWLWLVPKDGHRLETK